MNLVHKGYDLHSDLQSAKINVLTREQNTDVKASLFFPKQ